MISKNNILDFLTKKRSAPTLRKIVKWILLIGGVLYFQTYFCIFIGILTLGSGACPIFSPFLLFLN